MKELKNDDIIIYDDEGKEYLMKILFTYTNEDREAEYVFIYDPNLPDDVYLMRYNDEHELFEVTDEQEIEEANEVLNTFNEDPMIQELKEND